MINIIFEITKWLARNCPYKNRGSFNFLIKNNTSTMLSIHNLSEITKYLEITTKKMNIPEFNLDFEDHSPDNEKYYITIYPIHELSSSYQSADITFSISLKKGKISFAMLTTIDWEEGSFTNRITTDYKIIFSNLNQIDAIIFNYLGIAEKFKIMNMKNRSKLKY